MTNFDYDLFVIGGGSGGVRAARISAGHGARVGLCEESRLGGTCVIRGCVPKKLLVYASQFSEAFADAAGYGWSVGETRFAWPEMVAAKEREITRLEGVYGKLLDQAGVESFEGRGRLVDPHTVEIETGQGRRRASAERILIAVGGRPTRLDIPGQEHAIISDDAFDLPEFPARALIVGGGYIAVEFAGIFNGLGSDVTLNYRRERILRGFDDDVRRVVEAGMKGRGVDFHYSANPVRIDRSGGGCRVEFDDDRTGDYDVVMFATGRHPYTGDLGLDAAGVETGPGGRVAVDDYSRTSVPHIFAVGDVTDRMALTPVALMEGHSFADTVFGGVDRPVDHANVPSAVFSQPSTSGVGMTEAEARDKYGEIRVFRSEFTPMKYTLSGRDEKGLMKILVDAGSDRVVGLHVVGPEAAEIVQGFAVAVRAGLTKAEFDRTIGIHPTSAEELVTMREPAA
ncbi:MAG: glutathione-disulfide reductase [Wenzhouxiangellaceae bacterium]|nr:glutathione-disulfide reductase [Wenzhouxiangellaceae bacterium]